MVAMTDVLSRPILRVTPTATPPARPVALVGALGAAAVALAGLLLCLGVSTTGWFAADSGSFAQAIGVGALGWLVGSGSGLTGGGVLVHAVPLGYLLAAAYALFRVGRWAGATSRVESWQDLAVGSLAMCGAYAGVGLVTALVTNVGGVHAPGARVVGAFVLTAGVFGGAGLLRGSGRDEALLARLPGGVRASLVGGIAGALAMVCVSALVFVASMVAHFSTADTLADGMHAGVVGGAILALIGAAVVPNAVLCAGAFVVGPGFAVGGGTQVSPSGVHLGLLPDFPVLAALPQSTDAWWLPVLVVVPLMAGGVAGLVATRRYAVGGVDRAALWGVLAGLIGGTCFGLMTFFATGAVGPGRLEHIGPDVLLTTLVSAAAFALGGAVAAAARTWRAGARTSPGGRSWRRLLPSRGSGAAADPGAGAAPVAAPAAGESVAAEPAVTESAVVDGVEAGPAAAEPVAVADPADDEVTQQIGTPTESD